MLLYSSSKLVHYIMLECVHNSVVKHKYKGILCVSYPMMYRSSIVLEDDTHFINEYNNIYSKKDIVRYVR